MNQTRRVISTVGALSLFALGVAIAQTPTPGTPDERRQQIIQQMRERQTQQREQAQERFQKQQQFQQGNKQIQQVPKQVQLETKQVQDPGDVQAEQVKQLRDRQLKQTQLKKSGEDADQGQIQASDRAEQLRRLREQREADQQSRIKKLQTQGETKTDQTNPSSQLESRNARLEELKKQREAADAERKAKLEEFRGKQGLQTKKEGLQGQESLQGQEGQQVDARKARLEELKKQREAADAERKAKLEELRGKQGLQTKKDGLQGVEGQQGQQGQQVDARKARLEELKKQREAADAERKAKLEELRGKQGLQTKKDGLQGVEGQQGQQLDARKTRLEELKKQREAADAERKAKLEELRGKQGLQTKKDGQLGQQGQPDAKQAQLEELRKQQQVKFDEQKQQRETRALEQQKRIEEMRKQRDTQFQTLKLDQQKKQDLFAEARKGKLDQNAIQTLRKTNDGDALRQTMLNLRESGKSKDQIRKDYFESRQKNRDLQSALTSMNAGDRSALMGANFSRDKFKDGGYSRFLSRDDFATRYGDLKMKPRYELNRMQLADMHRGRIPDGIMRPRDWYYVGRPLQQEINITNININFGNTYVVNNFLPPPIYAGGRPDYAGFSWNYWDGRRFYDHSFAINMFIGLGHVRYGGFDGCMVSNRYYCYGYGWIDGCIDYGQCRVWVPGFWSPYTVTECCDCQVWVEPVYETVWTGCCWETVQVDGGYFTNSGNSDCREVTRYRWVPGHYQFYYA